MSDERGANPRWNWICGVCGALMKARWMKLVGANPAPEISGLQELPGRSSYFKGRDPSKWHTRVPNYAAVRYKDVYPGIDLIYYGNQEELEFDWWLAPGADPKLIKLAIHG